MVHVAGWQELLSLAESVEDPRIHLRLCRQRRVCAARLGKFKVRSKAARLATRVVLRESLENQTATERPGHERQKKSNFEN